MRPVDISTESIRAFAARDRSAIADLKRDHWAQLYRAEGASTTIAIGRSLYEHAARTQPEYPNQAEQDRDLAELVIFKRQLDKIAHALRHIR